jgi:hypothetical protein
MHDVPAKPQWARRRAAVKASGEWGRSARLRAHPRVKRARCRQEGGRNRVGQGRDLRPANRRGGDRDGVRVERTVGAMLEQMSIPGSRGWVSGASVWLHPLGSDRRTDLGPGSTVLGSQCMRDRRRERGHQDCQNGHPGCQQAGGAMEAHDTECIGASRRCSILETGWGRIGSARGGSIPARPYAARPTSMPGPQGAACRSASLFPIKLLRQSLAGHQPRLEVEAVAVVVPRLRPEGQAQHRGEAAEHEHRVGAEQLHQ